MYRNMITANVVRTREQVTTVFLLDVLRRQSFKLELKGLFPSYFFVGLTGDGPMYIDGSETITAKE